MRSNAIARRVGVLLADDGNWLKRNFGFTDAGNKKGCLVGAIRFACREAGDPSGKMASRAIHHFQKAVLKFGRDSGVILFNDDNATTFSDIRKVIRIASR